MLFINYFKLFWFLSIVDLKKLYTQKKNQDYQLSIFGRMNTKITTYLSQVGCRA